MPDTTMITDEHLTREFIAIVGKVYPAAGKLLTHCFVKLTGSRARRLSRQLYYVGIYYPDTIAEAIKHHDTEFRDIALNMGLGEAICINANHLLLNSPLTLKQNNPRFWLELNWVVTQAKS